MSIKKYVIEKKIWFFSWWKWLFFALMLLFLLCLFLKCCTVKTSAANAVDPSINSVVEVPFKSERLPDQPNRLLKIDTNKIIKGNLAQSKSDGTWTLILHPFYTPDKLYIKLVDTKYNEHQSYMNLIFREQNL